MTTAARSMATTTSTPTSAPDPAESPFQLEIRYKLIAKRETMKSWHEKTVSKCESHKSNHGIIFNETSDIFGFYGYILRCYHNKTMICSKRTSRLSLPPSTIKNRANDNAAMPKDKKGLQHDAASPLCLSSLVTVSIESEISARIIVGDVLHHACQGFLVIGYKSSLHVCT